MVFIHKKSCLSSATIAVALALGTDSSFAEGCFDNARHFHTDDWVHCQPIVPDEVFLYYTPLPDEGNVMLGLHVTKDSFGWSALAIGGNGGMKGASQIVVRIDENEEWVAEDRYSMDYVTPSLDEQQDVKLLFADQSDEGETSWGVLLPLNSCDDPFDYEIQDINLFMHWALGTDHTFSFHGTRRGQFHARLLQAPAVSAKDEDLPYFDFLMPSVPVVHEGDGDPFNPYKCAIFDMSVMSEGHSISDEKIHVTHFSPWVPDASKPYVHHMVLYSCPDFADGWAHLDVIEDCQSMPPGCHFVKWGWAVGNDDYPLPPHVGMPIEERWLVLQTHYYNRNLDEGVVDNSGFRAYSSTDLREMEAGVMVLSGGASQLQRPDMPTGLEQYQLSPFVVPSACTAELWKEPLNILGVMHHMHFRGTKIELVVERDGRNLGPMRTEHHFDFTHQSLEEPNPDFQTLLPGDQITTFCTYNTLDATSDVAFGDSSSQEMCWSAVLYYPRQESEVFVYQPTLTNISQCLLPATDDVFVQLNASLCAQELFENVPKFFDVERMVPFKFGAMDVCNGGEIFSLLLDLHPDACPACHATSNCTVEEVAERAQSFCVEWCQTRSNVSAYPAPQDTADPFNGGTIGCPGETEFFVMPPIPNPPTCKARGNLSQVVMLQPPKSGSFTLSTWIVSLAALVSVVWNL